jgi:hypothetical protein
MDEATGRRIIALRQVIQENFAAEHWHEVGLMTGQSQIINGYPRLLRSLDWGDDDYSGNILGVLTQIAERDFGAYLKVEEYVNQRFAPPSEYVSAVPAARRITFAPNVFSVPDAAVESDLVAVMMPINSAFAGTYQAIGRACSRASLRSSRADDIWESSTIIQDIFSLIFRAQIVVVDFTGRNSNVMYETGIAHTLGKAVIPISQSMSDVPFDLTHHRILIYLNNAQGLQELEGQLFERIWYLSRNIGS